MVRSASKQTSSLRHEEVRAEILEAAAAAIAEHGFYGMSMRGLARATAMALGNCYNYFSSKEDLLFALQQQAFQTLISTVRKALEGVESPVAGLYVFIFTHIRYVADHRAVMRVLVHEASALPAARRKTIRAFKNRYFRIGRELVSAIITNSCHRSGGHSRPQPDKIEIERATYSIFGMLNWSYGWYRPRRHGSPHEVAATIHRIALCGLLAKYSPQRFQEQMRKHLATILPPPLIRGLDGEA